MSTNPGRVFPAGFEDLERFAGWALPSEQARLARRIAAAPAEIRDLYEAMATRLPAVLEHLDRLPLQDLGEADSRLLWLTYATAEVIMATEKFAAEGVVPLALDARRFAPLHETEGLFRS
jgi:hypothetical protein